MALQNSGAISINDIVGEFGGTAPHSISEYYRGGTEVGSSNTNVPTSGAIALSEFYGASDVTFIGGTGGQTTTSGQYKFHYFTSSGQFTVTSTASGASNQVDYVIIAGGGGGGSASNGVGGGGGGAGGYRTGSISNVSATNYAITIGGGGNGADAVPGHADNAETGDNGGQTTAFGVTNQSGGGGGAFNRVEGGANGAPGGSGGGSAYERSAGTGISGQGNNGGSHQYDKSGGGGGKGGAGGIGPGGSGSSTGDANYNGATRAGGGGGGKPSTGGPASGGGGDGGGRGGDQPGAGQGGTGGGGGGGGNFGGGYYGANGGSGIVMVRYQVA